MTNLLLRNGEWDSVDPASASWRYLSFRLERLRDGEEVTRRTEDEEVALVSLGGRFAVENDCSAQSRSGTSEPLTSSERQDAT